METLSWNVCRLISWSVHRWVDQILSLTLCYKMGLYFSTHRFLFTTLMNTQRESLPMFLMNMQLSLIMDAGMYCYFFELTLNVMLPFKFRFGQKTSPLSLCKLFLGVFILKFIIFYEKYDLVGVKSSTINKCVESSLISLGVCFQSNRGLHLYV